MVIGKKEQKRLEREHCAQVSLLCRQKLMGYAESFEELGKSFCEEVGIASRNVPQMLFPLRNGKHLNMMKKL